MGKAASLTSGFASNIGSVLSGVGKAVAAGVGVAAAGVGAMTKASVDNFANYEQLVGGVETLFKGSADVVKGYADGAFKTAGMSANDYMDTVTSFSATLLQSLGGDTAAAADMADLAITDMSDNANKMGTDISMIQNAYQGFAKGNYTMLDNLKLGYGGTAREMARLVNESGLLSEAQKINLDDTQNLGAALQDVGFDTIIQAIHEIQVQMGITGTTAAEAADTISGSVSSMKAAWDNWLVGLANPDADLTGLTQTLVDSFGTVVDNVLPVVGRIGESLVQVFADTTGIDISPAIAKIQEFSTAATDIVTGLISAFNTGGLSGVFGEIITQVEGLTGLDLSGVKDAFAGIAEIIERLKAAGQGGGIGGIIDEIIAMVQETTGVDISPVVDALGGIADVVMRLINAGANGGGIGGIVDELVSMISEMTGVDISPVVDALGGIVEEIKKASGLSLSEIASSVGEFIGNFKDSGTAELLSKAAEGIGKLAEKFGEIAGGAIQVAADAIGFLLNNLDLIIPVAAGVVAAFAAFSAVQTIIGIINGVKTAFMALNAVMAANPIGLIIALVAGLVAAFITAYQTSDEFRAKVDAAMEAVKTVVQNVVGAIAKFFTEDIPNAFTGAVEAIKAKVSEFVQAGKDLIEGLKNGIMEKVNSIINSVKEAAGKVIDAVKGVFGIHSPSRVFAEIGRNLVLGLEQGFDSEITAARAKITSAMDFGDAHASVDFASSAVGKSSAGMIGGLMSALPDTGGVYNINLVVDGRTMASVMFDPLNGIAKQKGVSAAW